MPMRILGKGRDSYLLAGYLDKRSRWSSWSERYYVLTPSTLYCFKKDRQQLYGDLRGKALVESISVRQLPKQPWCFELTNYNSESNSSKQRVLRASSEQECLIWVKAIEDAKRNIVDRKRSLSSVSISDPAFQSTDGQIKDNTVARQIVTSGLIRGVSPPPSGSGQLSSQSQVVADVAASYPSSSSSSVATHPKITTSSSEAFETQPQRKRLDSLPLIHPNQMLPSRPAMRPSLEDPIAHQLDFTHSPYYDLVNSALPTATNSSSASALHSGAPTLNRIPSQYHNAPWTQPCALVTLSKPASPLYTPFPSILSHAHQLIAQCIPWGHSIAFELPESSLLVVALFFVSHLTFAGSICS